MTNPGAVASTSSPPATYSTFPLKRGGSVEVEVEEDVVGDVVTLPSGVAGGSKMPSVVGSYVLVLEEEVVLEVLEVLVLVKDVDVVNDVVVNEVDEIVVVPEVEVEELVDAFPANTSYNSADEITPSRSRSYLQTKQAVYLRARVAGCGGGRKGYKKTQ
jgi:hypothetical protein